MENTASTKEDQRARGRYVEKVLSYKNGYVQAMQELEDGKIRLVSDTGVYDSADKGESWQPWEAMPEEMKTDLKGDGFLTIVTISREGDIFYSYVEEEESYKLIKKDGSMRQVSLDLPQEENIEGSTMLGVRLSEARFTDKGDLLCQSAAESVSDG